MKVSGFRPSVVGAFRALYRDLDELDLGNVPGIFKPKSFNCGHVDQSRVCSARAIVAIALDEAVADKKMQVNRASEKIASQRGKLRPILASRSKILQPLEIGARSF